MHFFRQTRYQKLSPKLTGDLGLWYPSQNEALAGVELPQVGAASVRRGHRARCCREMQQHTEEHQETHLYPVLKKTLPLLVRVISAEDPRGDPGFSVQGFVTVFILSAEALLPSGPREAPVNRSGDRRKQRGGRSGVFVRDKSCDTRL